MGDRDHQIIRARVTFWPGEQLACVWPCDPEEDERVWLVDRAGRPVGVLVPFTYGMFGGRR